MLDGQLSTTNMLLGIMAVVSLIEGLLLVAIGIMAYKAYSTAMKAVREIEQRQIAPLTAKVHALLTTVGGVMDDVKDITSRVDAQTERVDTAIRSTIDRVDVATDRVRTSVTSRVRRVAVLVQSLRTAFSGTFNGDDNGRSRTAPRGAGFE